MSCTCTCLQAVVIFVVLYKVLDWLIRRFYVGKYSERYILVTGCDTGFGNLIAKRLDSLGCHVFAGCLTETGETDLKKSCSDKLYTISLDVSKPDSVRNAYEIVKAKLPQSKGLWAVLNNAGILGPPSPPDWITVDSYKSVAAINLYGLIDVTMTFLPLVKASHGRIVNTASVAGRISVASLVPYCVSKYGVEAFSDGLRRAMYAFNVKVILIEPGWYKTPITSRENLVPNVTRAWNQATPEVKAEYGEEFFKYSSTELFDNFDRTGSTKPNHVVDAYENALLSRCPRARYVVGNDAKFIFLPVQALPEWISDWILFKSALNQPLPAAVIASNERK